MKGLNLSGTSGFLSFVSLLSWLNEHRISSLVQKDHYDRFEVCRPYIRSSSERGFANVEGILSELCEIVQWFEDENDKTTFFLDG